MKKSIIALVLLVTSCTDRDCFKQVDDGYVLLKVKDQPYILSGDIENVDVTCTHYSHVATLDSTRARRLEKLLANNDYRADRDPASCPVDFCIARVINGKVTDKIFLGCQGEMLYQLDDEGINRIGLNEDGVSELYRIIK
jgi:hypothetical protein